MSKQEGESLFFCVVLIPLPFTSAYFKDWTQSPQIHQWFLPDGFFAKA